MSRKLVVYLDTSALFAGIWSASGGARMILKLGEASVVVLLVGYQVRTEIEGEMRVKAPDLLGNLALILDRSQITTAADPDQKIYEKCQEFIQQQGDAYIIASAWTNEVDYFVTLDRKHLINNRPLREAIPFPMGTPGDFLNWLSSHIYSH